MTARETLHRPVEELTEADLPTAARILEALQMSADPMLRMLSKAPADDEADDDDSDGGLTEARQEAQAGSLLSHEELKGKLRGRRPLLSS
jgi:hypothetical protein